MPSRAADTCYTLLELVNANCEMLLVSWACDDSMEYRLEWPSPTEGWLGHVLTPPVSRGALSPDTLYKFRLRHRRRGAECWSQPSGVQEFHTSYPMPEPVFQGDVRVSVTCSSATLRWSAPQDTLAKVTRYRIRLCEADCVTDAQHELAGDLPPGDSNTGQQLSAVGESGDESHNIFTTEDECTFAHLKSGGAYTAAIAMQSKSGLWSAFAPETAFTVGSTVPATLSYLDVETTESAFASLHLHWRPPKCNGAPITGYSVRYHSVSDPDVVAELSTGAHPEVVLQGLEADMGYSVQLRASNANGVAGWSKPYATRTLCPARFASDLRLEQATTDSVRVGWRRVSTTRHSILSYTLEGCRQGFPYTELLRVEAGGQEEYSYTYELLPPDAAVSLRLRATTVCDGVPVTSPPGQEVVFRTLPARPAQPKPPGLADTPRGAALEWCSPPACGAPIASWRLKFCSSDRSDVHPVVGVPCGGGSGGVWLWDDAVRSHVRPGHKLLVFLAAQNKIGDSAWSKPLAVTEVGGKLAAL